MKVASLFVVGILLLSDAELLLGHVNTIEELTDILVSHQNGLVDLSSYSLCGDRKSVV